MTTNIADRLVSSVQSVPSANSMKGRPHFLCSSSPIPMRSHAVYHFHITTGGIDDESM
ncbi:unnamed protein product [Penicillium salamii]|uniref:Uncharacterized protein n=1 Tax=Penicillium salamii TaxID=1612424 RepID=A0A9W4I0S7_9EURO|nr:unnamed protein product [Penicillium salamii]CAG8092298.1 unnamed protein product [Penicillium salamii]CAG8129355.1 unnamed protein product [Penicillium salamii]CAG8146736.1 unnamed protein product [Penicillium salamii]CAG8180777.1 unnamed protein product [Penicillium salamii]